MAKRITIWGIIAIILGIAYFYSEKFLAGYVKNNIEVARGNVIAVDQNTSSIIRNGSFEHPFASIGDALDFQSGHREFSTILVYPGEYAESLVLRDNTVLMGVSDGVVIKGPMEQNEPIVVPGNRTILANLTISGGSYGVYIPKDIGPVTLFRCMVQSAGKWGVYNEKHERTETAKLSLIESVVENNARQGLYLQRGTFYMSNSKVSGNGEEGVDLHVGMKSEIRNSEISANGEGGIETELEDIELVVDNCAIRQNGSSGINVQSSGFNSGILLRNNSISNNVGFGIRCAIHANPKPFPSVYFSDMLKIDTSNTIFENGSARIDPNCRR